MQRVGRSPRYAEQITPDALVSEAIRLTSRWLAIGERSLWHVTHRVENHLEKPVAEVREAMLSME